MLDVGRITFSRLELKNEDDMKSKFLIFWQHIMFPWIDIVASFFGDQGYLINFWLTNYFTTFEKNILIRRGPGGPLT